MPPHYYLKQGSGLDRAVLLRFLQHTYHELCPQANLAHLAHTAEQYFSGHTPLWWVEWHNPDRPTPTGLMDQICRDFPSTKVGCLWMGRATDQCRGDRHSHIFLLYVAPQHRRQGLGRALMETAEQWAKKQGDRQITLQVFINNPIAIELYKNLGYQTQALTLMKSFEP